MLCCKIFQILSYELRTKTMNVISRETSNENIFKTSVYSPTRTTDRKSRRWVPFYYNNCIELFFRATDDELIFEAPEKSSELYYELVKSKIETMSDALTWAVKKHGSAPIMGTREIIAELDEVQPNGRMFKKYNLGDYR